MLPANRVNSHRRSRDYLVQTAGNGDPVHNVCISHRIPCAWEQQGLNKRKEETKEKSLKSSKINGRQEGEHEGEKSQT